MGVASYFLGGCHSVTQRRPTNNHDQNKTSIHRALPGSGLDHEHRPPVLRYASWVYSAASLGAFAASRCAVACELLCQVAPRVLAWKMTELFYIFPRYFECLVWNDPAFFCHKSEGSSYFLCFLHFFFRYFFLVWTVTRTEKGQ